MTAALLSFYCRLCRWNDDLPYTYDTFDYDYCDDEGYPFDTSSDLVSGWVIE